MTVVQSHQSAAPNQREAFHGGPRNIRGICPFIALLGDAHGDTHAQSIRVRIHRAREGTADHHVTQAACEAPNSLDEVGRPHDDLVSPVVHRHVLRPQVRAERVRNDAEYPNSRFALHESLVLQSCRRPSLCGRAT